MDGPSVCQETTSTTPFSLMFGHEPHLPEDVMSVLREMQVQTNLGRKGKEDISCMYIMMILQC